jgi:hypothetical protein
MRLPITCLHCMREGSKSAKPFTLAEWNDEGRYEAICPKGHSAIIILQGQKFELLFDIGAHAIIDGYYREAVSSFASSLERFFEFFTTSVLFQCGVDVETVSKGWKLVSAQSERQLGAFIFLYVRELKKIPTLLATNSVSFRNDVIHKGVVPSRKQALKFGTEVLTLMQDQLKEVKEKIPDGVRICMVEHLKRSRRTADEWAGTMTMPTIISLSRDDKAYNSRTLSDALEELRQWRARWDDAWQPQSAAPGPA